MSSTVEQRSLIARANDAVEKLFDFDHYGNTATERFSMRMAAGMLIKDQCAEIARLNAVLGAAAAKSETPAIPADYFDTHPLEAPDAYKALTAGEWKGKQP